ncbi:MMPL family transporter, partial [bacterium]|nr:MMPL family transporter [bacterium]
FGGSESIFIAFSVQKISKKSILKLSELDIELKKEKDVSRTLSILKLLKSKVDHASLNEKRLKKLNKTILHNSFYSQNFVGKNSKSLGILVTYKSDLNEKQKLDLTVRLKKRLTSFFKLQKYYLAGYPVQNEAYIRLIKKNTVLFSSLALIAGILILAIMYCNFRLVFGITIVSLVPVIWLFGFVYFIKGTLNTLTTLLIPLVLSITLSISIRLIAGSISNLKKYEVPFAVSNAMISLFRPVMLCGLTTFLGFVSLCLSKIKVVYYFGLFSAIGALLATFFGYVLTPMVLLMVLKKTNHQYYRRIWFDKFSRKTIMLIRSIVLKHKKKTLLIFIIIVFISIFGLGKLKPGSSSLDAFLKSSHVSKSAEFINNNFSGIYSINVILYNSEGEIISYKILKKIEGFQEKLKKEENVINVFSLIDLFKDLHFNITNHYTELPDTDRELKIFCRYFMKKGILLPFLNRFNDEMNIIVRVEKPEAFEIMRLVQKIKTYSKTIFNDDIRVKVTGRLYLGALINVQTVKMELISFIGAFTCIILIISLVFRSIYIGLISLFVNIIPITVSYGIMGLLGYSLDVATGTVATVTIGLIVDDTIHFLDSYREFSLGKVKKNAVSKTIISVGKPVIQTSTVLVLSLLILVSGSFYPTINFGLFSAITLFFALLCDLLLLPILLNK